MPSTVSPLYLPYISLDLVLELERGQRVVPSEAVIHARRAQLLRLRAVSSKLLVWVVSSRLLG